MQYKVGTMPTHAVVWDLEMVPDLKGFAAANDLVSKSDDEIREPPWATRFANTSFTRFLASADIDQGRLYSSGTMALSRIWLPHAGQVMIGSTNCLAMCVDADLNEPMRCN
jgi:hypothetical protein